MEHIEKMNFIQEETGIAYTIIVVFISLILGALLFMVFQEAFTPLVDRFNENVAEGVVSENSVDTTNTVLKIFTLAVPFFILIAIVEFAIIKAIERKKQI